MPAQKYTQEELALEEINRLSEELARKQQEIAAVPKQLERERREMENTLPPMAEIAERKMRAKHEADAANGAPARNRQKTHDYSIFLFFLLCACTAAIIAWGLQLMQR